MKHIPKSNKSFLWQALLASTLITVVSTPAFSALTDITLSTDTTTTAGPGGYNIKAGNVTLSVVNGDPLNNTGGISVDNNNGVPLTPFGKATVLFLGSSVVSGGLGATNPLDQVQITGGAGSTVELKGDVVVDQGVVFMGAASTTTTLQLDDGVDILGLVGDVDSKVSTNVGNLSFTGGSTIFGSIGSTKAINDISVTGSKIVNVNGTTNANNITINGNTNTTTFGGAVVLNNGVSIIGANNTTSFSNTLNGKSISISGGITNALTLNDAVALSGDFTIQATSNTNTVKFTKALTVDDIALQGNTSTVTVSGATKATGISFTGTGNTLNLLGNVTAPNTNFSAENTVSYGDNVTLTGAIDNKSGADGVGTVLFQGSGGVTGTVGFTDNMKLVSLDGVAGSNVLFGSAVSTNTLAINDSNGTFNGVVTAPAITVDTGAATFNANAVGDVNFTDSGSVILGDNSTLTGKITTANNGDGDLVFKGNGTVTGTVGAAAKALNQVNIESGAGKAVNLQDDVFVVNGVNFVPGSTATTVLNLSDNADVTGNIDNKTISVVGIVNFLGSSTVTGSMGATKSLSLIDVKGTTETVTVTSTISADNIKVTGATNTVNFNDTVNANVGITFQGAGNTINFAKSVTSPFTNFAAENTANYADNVTVTGLIDNTSGSPSKGTLIFAGNGTVTGSVGATNKMNTITLNGAAGKNVNFNSTVATNILNINAATGNFTGDVVAPTINITSGTGNFDGNATGNISISNNGAVILADDKTISGFVDNTSGVASKGTLTLEGGGTVTGSIGATNSLNLVTLNSLSANPNETITFTGAIVNATTIAVKDDAVTPTTLVLNNPAMAVTGNITAELNDLNVLNVLNAATITGQIGAPGAVFNLMKVAQNGNTKVDGDIYATTVQFNGPNTLTLTDNSDINGNVTTTVNGQGILQLEGTTKITGTIGAPGLSLNAINLLGLNEVFTIGNDTYVNNLNIANDGTVIIQDNADFTGNIDNTSGVTSKGTLEFEGTGSVAGNIGTTNFLKAINVNTLAGAGEIVTLTGALVRATEIDVLGATTTLTLNKATMVLSTTAGIQSKTAGSNTLDINNALLINSDIGTTGAFALVKVGAVGPTTINGDIVATTTQFQGDNLLTLTSGSDVTGKIDTTVAGQGKLLLEGDHTITGTIGAANALNFINVAGASKTVNFQSDVKAGSVNFSGNANCATTINLSDGVDVIGKIDNTTGSTSAGTLNFAGDGSVSGTIGATNALCQINLQGAAGKLVTFGDDTKVGSGNINFTNDSKLNIADAADITGNIDNTTGVNGKGTLTFLGDSNMNGTIGATKSLANVFLNNAGKTVTFANNVNTNVFEFQANGTAALASGITVSGPITTTANNQGNVNFLGNFNINSQIGAPALALNSINVNGPAGTTVNLFEDIYAANTNVTAGGTLFAKDVVSTITGNVNLTAASGSTLAVATNATPLTITGNLNVPNGTVLQFDLSNVNVPTYIKVNGAATIDANSTVKLTNTPQAYAAGNYDIKLVDAAALGAINVPLNVNGDSLLLTFELEAQNAPNNDLLLHIDVNPASLYANRINTVGVAGALDAMAGQNFLGSLQGLLDQLPYFTNIEQLNDALAALAPIVDNSFTQETFAAQQLGYGAVSDRLRHVRQRKMIPGMKAPFESGFASGDDWDDNGHGQWFKLYGQYSDQNERNRVAGYNAETWGLAVGSDVSLNDLNLIGVSANLSHTYIGHDVSESTTSLYSLQGAVYGEQDFCEWFYFNWVTSVAYNKYTTERNFLFGLLPFSPKADFNGWQFGAKGEFGYEYLYEGFHIIPNTSLYYSYLALSGYNESGAGTASQSVDAQHYSMLKGGAGVRTGYTCPYDMGDRRSLIFQPELRFNMFYDFVNDNMNTTSQFTGGGPSFITRGATPAATSYNVGASMSVFSDFSNYIITMSYDYETKHDYTANAGFLRMRYEW